MADSLRFSELVRTVALPFFADSVQTANHAAPEKWGVTPYLPDSVRLNVGFCEVLTVGDVSIRVIVDRELASGCEAIKSGALKLEERETGGDYYLPAPGSRLVTLEVNEKTEALLSQLRRAHDLLIRTAAKRGFNRGSKNGHQDGAVEAVSYETNRELPLPTYSSVNESVPANDGWSNEELKASVEAYLDMKLKTQLGEDLNKKAYYRDLSKRYGRSEKSFEYRMQNISYVLSLQGRDWLTGLKPARNVGANVAAQIEELLAEVEKRSVNLVVKFEIQVQEAKKKAKLTKPAGDEKPKTTTSETTHYVRDPDVVAWVLEQANGMCECCQKAAPFQRFDGTPFLEVHHVRQLADKGPDTTDNAVALCPNCHRELHHGANSKALVEHLYAAVSRLVIPSTPLASSAIR